MLPSIEYVKTLVNGLKQWVENRVKSVRKELTDKVKDLPQADWDQNDPEAKDYVKNRLCYAEEIRETVYSNDQLNVTDDTQRFVIPELDTASGIQYEVSWDDKVSTYHFNSTSYYGRDWFWFGNASLAQPYGYFGASTDDSFLVTNNQLISDQVGVHSVTITSVRVDYHKLDPRFLTDVESALNENSKKILSTDYSEFITEDTPAKINKYGTTIATKVYGYTDHYYVPKFTNPDWNKILVIFSGSGKTYYDYTKTMSLSFSNGTGGTITKSPKKLDESPVTNDDLPFNVTVLALSAVDLYLLNPRGFSGSYNDLVDTPTIPTVTPFSIDSTSSDYSTTSTTYGDEVKTALLDGRDVWYIGAETDESGKTTTKYTKVSWFNIEKTDTEAKLIVGVGARTDDNSGAVTFAISV